MTEKLLTGTYIYAGLPEPSVLANEICLEKKSAV